MRLAVKVVPKSSRERVAGYVGDTLKVCVSAPPEHGRANAAVVRVLSEALGLPASSVRLVSGAASSRKIVEIDGLDEDAVRSRIGGAAPTA